MYVHVLTALQVLISVAGRFQFARDFRYRRFPPFNLRLHSSTTFVAVLKLIETFPMTDKDYQERLQAEAMETAKVKNLANSRYRFQKARERTFHGSKNQILGKFNSVIRTLIKIDNLKMKNLFSFF